MRLRLMGLAAGRVELDAASALTVDLSTSCEQAHAARGLPSSRLVSGLTSRLPQAAGAVVTDAGRAIVQAGRYHGVSGPVVV